MAILGNLDLLSQRHPAADPAVKRLIEGAIRSAERGATLTKRMLAFARRQELRPERVDVTRHVLGMVEMLQRSLGPTIEIEVDFEENLPPILVDPSQLELAILNLSLNARDAMVDGGRLRLGAQQVEIGTELATNLAPGRYVSITVTDTGTGMEEETLKRAAEPFFTTKSVGKGTGLGLSTVFGLAAQSGGHARIASQLGIGTRVELVLPVAAFGDADQPSASLPSVLKPVRSRSVLLVDDDPLVAEGVVGMLEYLGHRVLLASSGAEALALVRSGREIDLIITDHAMPEMTGVELARHLGEIKPGLPVVLVSGFAELPAPGSSTGMLRLNKPYRLEQLATLLAKVLDEEPVTSRAMGSASA
jgi:CheY-like chemotaxis protein